MKKILLFLALSVATTAQTITPPQPNYSQYGSYSRQMTVWRNVERQRQTQELENYRRFREEIRRNLPNVQNNYFPLRGRTARTRIIVNSDGSIDIRGQNRLRRSRVTWSERVY